ncbi:MAG: PQQ-binding-like beta-propeller repeat protein [Rickettsiales bacterium]|jgi:outer membrane protein assembly factor BamB|nr:PQQ-binding-like beta-propeller repeat protein [Rickettsiales bacterium]
MGGIKRYLWLAALAVLAACSATKTPLSGARASVFDIDPEPAESGRDITLDEPRLNASWTSAHGGPGNAVGHLAGRKNPALLFRKSIGGSGSRNLILYPPVAGGNVVFTIDGRLRVVATDLETGGTLWKNDGLESGAVLEFGALALDGGSLYAITDRSQLVKFDAKTGDLIYSRHFNSTLKSGLQVCGGRLLFATNSGDLVAVDAASGETLFTHRTLEERVGLVKGATPACEGERIVAAFAGGEAHMLMASTGTPIWLASVSKPDLRSINDIPDIVAGPVIVGGVAVVKSYSGAMKGLDLDDGSEIWSRAGGGTSTPAEDAGVLFDVDADGFASAIETSTGKSLWRTKLAPADKGARFHDPLLVNNLLLVATSGGEMIRLDPYSGKIISSERVASKIDASPLAVGGRLVVISGGDLMVFR